jgi:hypothetical protein
LGVETVRRQNARQREVQRLLKRLSETRKAFDDAMAVRLQCSFYRRTA